MEQSQDAPGPVLSGPRRLPPQSVPAPTDTSGPGGPCGRGSLAGEMALLGPALFARVSRLPRDPGPLRVRQGGVGEGQVRFHRRRVPGSRKWEERGSREQGDGKNVGAPGQGSGKSQGSRAQADETGPVPWGAGR